MTPEQRRAIDSIKTRYHFLSEPSRTHKEVVFALKWEGWHDYQIKAAMEELGREP